MFGGGGGNLNLEGRGTERHLNLPKENKRDWNTTLKFFILGQRKKRTRDPAISS